MPAFEIFDRVIIGIPENTTVIPMEKQHDTTYQQMHIIEIS
jgi:hypothetical protein